MARSKRLDLDGNSIEDIATILAAKYGANRVAILGNMPEKPRLSTGLEDVDAMLGGGLPMGSIVIAYGPKGCGKTAFGYQCASMVDKCLWVSANKQFSESAYRRYSDKDNIVRIEPESLPDAFEAALMAIQKGIQLIVIDTLAALIPSIVLEKAEKGDLDGTAGIARHAVFLSEKLSLVHDALYQSNSVLLILNRASRNIEASNYQFPYTFQGGHHLRAEAAITLVLNKRKERADGIGVYGHTIIVGVEDSNISEPYQRTEVPALLSGEFTTKEVLDSHRLLLLKEAREARKALKAAQATVVTEEGVE